MTATPAAYSTVMYPNTADIKFDMDYYVKEHMPHVARVWGPRGLRSWQVIQFEKHPDGSAPPYHVQAILHWSSREDIEVIKEEQSKVLFDDIANYSNVSPIFMVGHWNAAPTDA